MAVFNYRPMKSAKSSSYRYLKSMLCFTGGMLVLLCGYLILSWLSPNEANVSESRKIEHSDLQYIHPTVKVPQMEDLSPHWSFVPSFHASEESIQRIPKILHQVWDSEQVPRTFENWIRTWKIVNPKWQYWFWTLDAVRDLVAQHYNEHLVLYDSYESAIFRADVMRYFVLHRYGGVYADLDMDALRPLDNWTTNYNCVLSEESYEHSFIVHEKLTTNIVNGFIACRAGHPLMKKAINFLPAAAFRHFGEYLKATGPLFFNDVYERYRRGGSRGPNDEVTIVPPKYFLPTYDKSESDTISGKCISAARKKLPEKGQLLCFELMKRSFRNEPDVIAYTNHHWLHSYMYDESWKTTDTLEVLSLVPSVTFGSTALNNSAVKIALK